MSEWHRENPELAEEIAKLPPSMQNAAERALIPDPSDWADQERKERKERREADFFHDQEPGRWGDHASPARMRRDVERDREEDEQRRP